MIKRDLAAYTILAAAALYSVDASAQRKIDFCEPIPTARTNMDMIASGKLGENGATYQSFKPNANTILTFIYRESDKRSRELVGYTRSTKIPLDPSNPESSNYMTDSLGCMKVANKFRKVPIMELVERLSR